MHQVLYVVFGSEPYCGISLSKVRTDKEDWVHSEFLDHWTAAPRMNHAKQLIVRPEIKRAGTLLKLSRKQLRIYVMFLTGHGIFKAHLHMMGIVSNKLFRFCNVKD